MSGIPKLTRSDHVASLALPPSRFRTGIRSLRQGGVLLRIGVCVVTVLAIWMITGGWAPPFGFRSGQIPPRDITARVAFQVLDPQGTEQLRLRNRRARECVYVLDARPLQELQFALKNRVFQILAAAAASGVPTDVWQPFLAGPQKLTDTDDQAAFDSLHAALADDQDLTRFDQAVRRAMEPFERSGLLESLQHAAEEGSQMKLAVRTLDQSGELRVVRLEDVQIAVVTADLPARLERAFRQAGFPPEHVAQIVPLVANWLLNHGFPATLKFDREATEKRSRYAVEEVQVHRRFSPGDKLAGAGEVLTRVRRNLVHNEHGAVVAELTVWQKVGYSIACWGMYGALFVLCGAYVWYHQPRLWQDLWRLTSLSVALVVTVAVARVCGVDAWQAELIPVTLFAMAMTIAYTRDLALLLSAALVMIVSIALGLGLVEFVVMIATAATAILLLNRVRSRTKLLYVGLGAGTAALLTTIGMSVLTDQSIGLPDAVNFLDSATLPSAWATFAMPVLVSAAWHGCCGVLAGLVMTGLLPFVERWFDVQTDISLLELGDAAHPLLQELARRAPGTYNHSINVASLAETAAESIGANGLLVRVGSYFHDIGKVFKPGYFVENQQREKNLHDSLLPAMSTLVIIAHVKDGADLARQNRLPESIIHFIEQHHGTTLVEYFYQQATRQKELNPDQEDVEENSFRYPGPKPQTREAGVLMLADAVESASRTLVDPTPARIEGLVESIMMKRLLDGQFDDCGMTLTELSIVQDCLVKSLTAVYHGRIKYPGQQTA